MKKKIILLAGAPGSGKSYMCNVVKGVLDNMGYSIDYFYPGAYFREEAAKKTPEGLEFAKLMAVGQSIPGQKTAELLAQMIEKSTNQAIICDGCPRSLEQLNAMWHQLRQHQVLVLFRNTPREVILEQIKNRRMCSSCQEIIHFPNSEHCPHCGGLLVPRPDDEIINQRLDLFEKETLPVIARLKKFYEPWFVELDGKVDISLSAKELIRVVENFFS